MATLSALKKLKKFIERNPFEGFEEPTGIAKGIAESVKKDLAGKDTVQQMWKQIYEGEGAEDHHEVQMHEGEEVTLPKHAETANHGHIEAGLEYHREITHSSERAHHRETSEVGQKV